MKTGADKSTTSTPSTSHTSSQPFFGKAGRSGFFEPVSTGTLPFVQAKMTVNKPGDKFEQEADRMADRVMRMPQPEEKIQKSDRRTAEAKEDKIQKKEEDKIQKSEVKEEKIQKKEEEKIQRRGDGTPSVGAGTQSAIQNKTTGGQPLSSDVKSFMEPRIGADFSNVRIHNDQESAGLNNQLSARAFTYQNHIFFSRDQYQPGTSEGKQLLAHELTHTVQQGAAIQRQPTTISTTTTPPPIQRLGVQDALDYFADKANIIPGFRLLTVIMGFNPINRQSVSRSAANILRALIELIPGGNFITQALDNHGIFNKAGAWIEQKISILGDIGGEIVNGLKQFLDSLGWRDIFDLGGVWERAKRIFTGPIGRLIDFGVSVAVEILKMVKDAVLKPLAALAKDTRGYDLLKAVLGEDPITGEPVPRNADTLVGGFMKLIGQEEIWENIKKGNAIARAYAWFQGALNGLMGFVRAIPRKVIDTIKSLTFQDVITVVGAFGKVVGAFVNIATEFISWGLNQVISLLEILFSVVAPGAVPYIAKARAAFHTIIKDPIGFVRNLVNAGKKGFQLFANNIGTHLKNALIKWLTGPLGDAGVYIPQSFSLMEIVKLVLSVLGLTWQNIRSKLVKIIPEPVLVGLEKTAGILVTLVKDGPAAAWEQIKAELTELKDQLIGQVTEMVTGEIVKAAVTKLVSMLNPAGAVIQAIMAIYNTITFFIQKINQIAATVGAFIDSISAIAAGQIDNAAKKVETTMANTLVIIIGFLAKFVGLGNVPDKLVGIVKKIRQPIDKGLDKIVGWLGSVLKKIKSAIVLQFTKRKSFSAGSESHQMWISDDGDPQVASTAMPLGTRIGVWKRGVSKLPTQDQTTANSYLTKVSTVNEDLRKAALDAIKAKEKNIAKDVDSAQTIIDKKQIELQPLLAKLFMLFGDTKTEAGSEGDAKVFALIEAYDLLVVPLKKKGLVSGSPSTVSKSFKGQWNANMYPQARGWVVQMERVLASAKNIGTGRFPYLTGVEVKIPGTEIDYTVKDRETENSVALDVAVEVKNWGAMKDRPTKGGKTLTVEQQIQQRISSLRNQVQTSLKNPVYSAVVVEIKGYDVVPQAMRDNLTREFTNFTNMATMLGKRFSWKKI